MIGVGQALQSGRLYDEKAITLRGSLSYCDHVVLTNDGPKSLIVTNSTKGATTVPTDVMHL